MDSSASKLGKLLLFHKSSQIGLVFLMLATLFANAKAQDSVDKIVATVSDGARVELITYSNLIWQLAMIPNISINPPSSEDLNSALQVIIKQRLLSLEANRLPGDEPTQNEVNNEIKRIADQFPSPAAFVLRLNSVGFKSASDENFVKLITDRVAIEKYIDFRFRAFVVITTEEEKKYYREVYAPEFRKNNPGLLLPPFDEVQSSINQILTERTVENQIEAFLDEARQHSTVEIISSV